jgi:hypothetical protein
MEVIDWYYHIFETWLNSAKEEEKKEKAKKKENCKDRETIVRCAGGKLIWKWRWQWV